MKIIGLLGGMSWEATATYYRLINEEVKLRLGGLHSAKIVMYSVDFDEVEVLQREERWEEAANVMVREGRRIEKGGADFLVLCTNTMHKTAEALQSGLEIPLLHIADATGERVKESEVTKVGLLGTRYTMEQDFYKGRLASMHGLEVMVPVEGDIEFVNEVIFSELCVGRISDSSRKEFRRIIESFVSGGAQGVILGCTEISLLVTSECTPVTVFDTTEIHAKKAVDWALAV